MASLLDDESRNVLPNWRDYDKTARLGEFGSTAIHSPHFEYFPIDEYIYAWQNNKSIPYAGDLISAAILNGHQTNNDAIEAARFILSHQDEATEILVRTAQSMIASPEDKLGSNQLSISQKIDRIANQEVFLRNEIKLLKHSRNYCYLNPIAYCEMARCYVTLGQFDKAKQAIETALHLAPNHRYVCRSAARFYLHIDDDDHARYVISKNPALLKDPWLLASEIAINTLMERNSRYIKKGAELITSQNYSLFSLSELSSALGSVEMINGNRKKCRNYFKTALLNPNDNSLAQAQFLLSKHSDLTFEFGGNIAIPNAFEAKAINALINDDYSKSLFSAVDWIDDMPYSRRPVQFAANIAYSFIKDYDIAIRLLDLGLNANPNNSTFLNNKAYACALSGKIEDAERIIQETKKLILPKDTVICLTATEGLTEFRKGNIEEGRRLYFEAIKMAKTTYPDQILANTAFLNYAREEARLDKDFDKSILNIIDKIPNDSKETIQLKKDVFNEIKR